MFMLYFMNKLLIKIKVNYNLGKFNFFLDVFFYYLYIVNGRFNFFLIFIVSLFLID